MFNFKPKLSKSPKSSRFENALFRFFVVPSLDSAIQANIKKRILNRILAEGEELRQADLLDKKLLKKDPSSSGLLDFLASIAEALLSLPKVLPNRTFRQSVRDNFRPQRTPRIFSFLRQATAFAALFVFAGGILLTTLVTQTQTAVAQLSVSSGVVKVRVADSPFFEDVLEFATIRLGDTIRVEANSTAELAFYDASKMKLTESTEVEITEFKRDFISRENSGVKVALLSGSVNAEVAKVDSSFEVETSTGSVEATSAKFSVAINSQTGSTKIETSEDVVAVKSINNSESVALVAGESVTFEDEDLIVAVTEIAELPALSEIQTELELTKVWSFDALIAAQKDDKKIAQDILANSRGKLTELLVAAGAEPVAGGEVEALEIFLRKNYPDGPGREIALQNLRQAAAVDEILNYYFVAPQKMRGVPVLEIVARDSYSPSGRLRNLFTILLAGELAHSEVRPLVENFSAELVTELSSNFISAKAEKRGNELLEGMKNQPIFIPALRKLQPLVAPEFAETIAQKIAEMEARVAEYIGG